MGAFAYLINTEIRSNDTSPETLDGIEHVSLEGPRYVHPLAWICCFRTSDLAPCTIASDGGPALDLRVPVTSVEDAVANLTASLPRYERLVGDKETAREHWQEAIESIRSLPHRYVTLNVAGFDLREPTQAGQFVRAFASPSDPLSGSDELFEYEHGVAPDRSTHNARVLHSQAHVTRVASPLEEQREFESLQAMAAMEGAAHKFKLGLAFLEGKGTPRDVETGLRWIFRAAMRDMKQALALLRDIRKNGRYRDIPVDKAMAAHWLDRIAQEDKG